MFEIPIKCIIITVYSLPRNVQWKGIEPYDIFFIYIYIVFFSIHPWYIFEFFEDIPPSIGQPTFIVIDQNSASPVGFLECNQGRTVKGN